MMKKGQYLTLETTILFVVGILITLTIFFTFTMIKTKIKTTTEKDKLKEVGNSITSAIVKVYEIGLISNSTELTFPIPKKINDKRYRIKVKNGNLFLKLSEEKTNATIPLERLNESINIYGSVFSSPGKIKIIYRNNNIIVGRD